MSRGTFYTGDTLHSDNETDGYREKKEDTGKEKDIEKKPGSLLWISQIYIATNVSKCC